MFGAASPGNQNAKKGRLFGDTVKRYALADNGIALRQVTEALFKVACEGDVPAIREIADRIDGKVKQVIVHEGDEDAPLVVQTAESAALAEKIRGILHAAAEHVIGEGSSADEPLLGARQDKSREPRVRESQRPDHRLPTKQVVVRADKLDGYSGGNEQLEP